MKKLLLSIFLIATLCGGMVYGDDYSLNGVFHMVSLEEDLDANTFDISNIGNLTSAKTIAGTETDQSITAVSDTVSSTTTHVDLSANADYVMTATPSIAAGVDGQLLWLHNVGSFTIDLQDDGVLSDSDVFLGGAEGTIKVASTMILHYSDDPAAGWYVMSNPNTASAGANADTLQVRNISGSGIAAGKCVYVTGWNVGLARTTIDLADADDSAKMPCIGITPASIGNGANGEVIVSGSLVGVVDTSSASGENVGVWVGTDGTGGFVYTRPTVDQIQRIGTVSRDANPGNILIDGAGRANDVPIDGSFDTLELGHATDTTITRPSGGDIAVENNIVYRAGGTDVAAGDMVTASDSAQGASELATDGETITGTATDRVVTPANLTALHAGADIDRGGYYFTQDQGQVDGTANGPTMWFDGVDDEISLGTMSGTNLDYGTGDFSYIIDVKQLDTNNSALFSAFEDSANRTYIRLILGRQPLIYGNTDNTVRFEYQTVDANAIEVGVQTSIGIVGDRSDAVYLYLNGGPEPLTEGTVMTTGDVDVNATAYIGFYSTLSEYGNFEMSRFLQFNLALTATEVKALSSGAPVPYKYIGASQTSLITGDNSDFDSDTGDWEDFGGAVFNGVVGDWNGGGGTGIGKFTLDNDSFPSGITIPSLLTLGKAYRVRGEFKLLSGSSVEMWFGDGVTLEQYSFTPTGSETFFEGEFVAAHANFYVTAAISQGQVILIDNMTVTQIGCVLQLEQSGIGHGQWIDTSGNELHGTVSGALPINLAVNHREKYVDLTLTGNSSFTLYKGYKVTSITVFETAGNALTGGIDIGYTAGSGTDLVSGTAVGANAFVNLGLTTAAVLGATHLTADDILYFSDGDDDGDFNGAEMQVRVEMERLTLN